MTGGVGEGLLGGLLEWERVYLAVCLVGWIAKAQKTLCSRAARHYVRMLIWHHLKRGDQVALRPNQMITTWPQQRLILPILLDSLRLETCLKSPKLSVKQVVCVSNAPYASSVRTKLTLVWLKTHHRSRRPLNHLAKVFSDHVGQKVLLHNKASVTRLPWPWAPAVFFNKNDKRS